MNRLAFDRVLRLFCLLLCGATAFESVHVSDASAADTEASRLWGQTGEQWKPAGRLPDFSYAGYHRGERPLPENRPDVSVKDFGAVGDGKTDDTAAFKRALTEAGGKVIAIPAGRYVITDILEIERSGTVLQGAGPRETVICVPKPLEKIRSNMGATTSGRPTSNYSWSGGIIWARGEWDGQALPRVTAPARRGAALLAVDRPDSFKVGDEVRLNMGDDDKCTLVRHLYAGDRVFPASVYESFGGVWYCWLSRQNLVEDS